MLAWGCGRVGFEPRLDASLGADADAHGGSDTFDALDRDAFGADTLDADAFDIDAFDIDAFDIDAFDIDAFDIDAFDADAFDTDAFDTDAFDAFRADACTPTVSYRDSDGDGYGDGDVASSGCAAPPGWVSRRGDCDDTSRWIHPLAPELCDGQDSDCDPRTLETCPDGGTGHFWNGTPYLRVRDGRSWFEAQAMCRAAGMNLATVETDDEQTFLESLAVGQTLWLGGTDASAEGEWFWDSRGVQFWSGGIGGRAFAGAYQAWQPGVEPNSSGDEDCLVLWSGYAGKWADEWCGRSYGYLCSL
jgi:hypothetical protein